MAKRTNMDSTPNTLASQIQEQTAKVKRLKQEVKKREKDLQVKDEIIHEAGILVELLTEQNSETKARASTTHVEEPTVDSFFASRSTHVIIEDWESSYRSCHDARPRCLVFNPNDTEVFLTSGFDGYMRFWQFESQKTLKELGGLSPEDLRNSKYPVGADWHREGNFCAAVFLGNDDDHANPTPPLQRISGIDSKITNPQMVVVNVRELQPDHPKAFVTFLRV
eukprot:TRINITY_DN2920_c0_g1_i14.p2 TRINITY_DN2920_c0_g1~~TRINITY_DN2920_c0_g1_i14.p2  ORF type:complete len:223 (-),score=52.60 TRINITY_DN2920_c0_g1_i14:2830-3498(-)